MWYDMAWWYDGDGMRREVMARLQWETRGDDVIWFGLMICWWRHGERNNDEEITMRNLWWRCDMIWPDDMMVTAWGEKWWRDYNEKLVVTMWYDLAWWYVGDGTGREIMTRRLQWETCGDDVIWYGVMIWWRRHEERNNVEEITMTNL